MRIVIIYSAIDEQERKTAFDFFHEKPEAVFEYGFSLFKMSTQRVGILNYNPPASRVVTIVIRKNHLSVL